MQLETFKKGNVTVIRPLEKRLDAYVASDFKQKMLALIQEGNSVLVLNWKEVEFIDSSGLGALVSVLKTLGAEGDIVICEVNETVMSLFKLTRLDKVFQILPTEQEAIDALK